MTLGSFARRASRATSRLVHRLPLRTPLFAGATLGLEERALAEEALSDRASWGLDEPVRRFEEKFGRWVGASHAYSFLGGRAALSAAIKALGLRPGDEVIVPAFTCVVVPNAFTYLGIKVRFVDVECQTFGLDAGSFAKSLGPKTKAVLIHHLFGLVARDYHACVEQARRKGIAVIEDCAQASGARMGKQVGLLADVAIHSLEKTKVITTVFGGIATTNDPVIGARLATHQLAAPWPDQGTTRSILSSVGPLVEASRSWITAREQPTPWVSTPEGEIEGTPPPYYGSRLPSPLAELGILQLRKAESFNERRRLRARRWDRLAEEIHLPKAHVVKGSTPVFLRYPTMVTPAMKTNTAWAARYGVRLGVWFLGTRHPVPGAAPGFPGAADAVARCVNFPTLWRGERP